MVAFLKPLSLRRSSSSSPEPASTPERRWSAGRANGRMERCQFVQQKQRRERSWEEKAHPYVYLDATQDPKGRWGASVRSMALLACVGVDEEGGMHLDAPGTCGSGPRGSAL